MMDLLENETLGDVAERDEAGQEQELREGKDGGAQAGPTLAERVIRAETRAILAQMGVPAASERYVLRLVQADKVSDANGEPDEGAIREAVQRVLTDIPALRGDSKRGFNPPPTHTADPFEEGFDMG